MFVEPSEQTLLVQGGFSGGQQVVGALEDQELADRTLHLVLFLSFHRFEVGAHIFLSKVESLFLGAVSPAAVDHTIQQSKENDESEHARDYYLQHE